MKKNKSFLFIVLIFFLVSFCGSETKKLPEKKTKIPLSVLYKKAYQNFENGSYQNALDDFNKIESDYSYTEWASKALLMKAFIYYDSAKYIEALEHLQRYKKLNKGNKNIAYVEYLSAMCLFDQLNFTGKDQSNSELALRQFQKIIQEYPNTVYAAESKFKIDLVNDQLAAREMYIARYYQIKGRWPAAIQRLNNVLENYKTTIYVEEALHRLVEVHYKLGNFEIAKKYAAVLGYNYNSSDWYKKSYKIIVDKNFENTKKSEKLSFKEKLKKLFN